MNILIIGGGGREHALAWKLNQSPKIEKIYCVPGNGGMASIAENVDLDIEDFSQLITFAKNHDIDLTVVGPEDPMVHGIVDAFRKEGLKIFGVNSKEAMLEGSKDFAKEFMVKYDIPTAKYDTFDNYDKALAGLAKYQPPIVIKADGLCLGKGVFICKNHEEAEKTLKHIFIDKAFGDQGNKVLVEEFLSGIEASLLCVVSNNQLFPMESAKDYKKIYEGDEGPNTGGVGCYSPSPLFDAAMKQRIKNEILTPIAKGLDKEGFNYDGILFIGLMIDEEGPKVLEFNVRFGDPETEVVLPRLQSDLVDIMIRALDHTLTENDFEWKDEVALTLVMTSGGYPGNYEKGKLITIKDFADNNLILFHNGTKVEDGRLLTNGGRVLSLTALAEDLASAADKVYKNVENIDFEGIYYRKDIGLDL